MRLLIGLVNVLVSHITKVPRIEAKPGQTTIVLTRNGIPLGRVILHQITMSTQNGTTAEFVDASHYMEARRIR